MTCGYVCPQCKGKGMTDTGQTCDWCQPDLPKPVPKPVSSEEKEEWLKAVHEGPCCGDLGINPDQSL